MLSAAPLPAQAAAPARIDAYLWRRMQDAGSGEKLPIYVVLADRLRHDHWFPRVDRLPLEARRALVVGELKAHAARTQRELIERLQHHERQGRLGALSSSWLGNFVRCRATADVVRDVARLDSVAEVRYEAAWPRHLVEDAAVTSGGRTAGDGPVNTRADRVWELGFTGRGIVLMNADSGINVQQRDLVHRLWTNPGEIAGNGIDDDGNGYVDDVHGWNFFDDDANIEDGGAHGTQTAGVLVGDGSCSGTVTGQAPGALVMTGALGPPTPQTGPFTPLGEVAQWEAIQYAIEMGAHIQTSSYSYKNGFVPPPDYRMHREIGDNSLAAGLIRTNSTGNNGALASSPTDPNRIPFNVSAPGNLPPPYIDPRQTLVGGKSGVIGVGAHDVVTNALVSYSPIGPFAWHLEDVLTVNPSYPVSTWGANHNDYPWFGGARLGLIKPDLTGPTNTTTTTGAGPSCALVAQSGTSNATPRVAGTVALWKEANISLTPEDVAMILHQAAAPSGFLPGKKNGWGAGRIDALAGLWLALCTHRVNGEAVWAQASPVAASLRWELDTVPDAPVVLLLGSERAAAGGSFGLAGHVVVALAGRADPNGDASLSVVVPRSVLGGRVYSQWLADDRVGATGRILVSNVIETVMTP